MIKQRTRYQRLVERVAGKDLEQLLREEYIDNGLSLEEISKKWDISICTVLKWMKQFDIPRRQMKFEFE